RLLPLARQYLQQEHDPAARQWAICVFDDLVEFTGPASAPHAAEFLAAISAALRQTEAPDLRQAAAYGVGVMATKGGDAYADFVLSTALPTMLDMLARSDARDTENIFATENIVATLAKILRAYGGRMPGDMHGRVLQTWFAALPVSNDEEEVPGVYEFLLQVMSERPEALVGGGAGAATHLVKVVAEALALCTLPEELAAALVALMQRTMAGLDDAAKRALWDEIPRAQQQALAAKALVFKPTMTDIPTLANFIDNTLVPADPSTETLAVTTPHTGATIAHVPLSGAAAVDTAVLSAKRAFPSWSQQTVKSRASVLLRLLTKLQAHSDELAQLIVREHGKTLSEAHGDVSKGLETLEYALGLPQTSQGHVLQVSGGVVCRDER
ncbi:hypothetical protein GGI05_006557, partial [Coemansia sp. RSA 2603]